MDDRQTLLISAGALWLTPDDLESRLTGAEIPDETQDLAGLLPQPGHALLPDALHQGRRALETFLWSEAYRCGEAFVWRDVYRWSDALLWGSTELWRAGCRWGDEAGDDAEPWVAGD